MACCTIDDLKKIVPEQDLIELTDDTVPPVSIIEANVDKAIADAEEIICSYGWLPTSGLRKMLACDIAVYRLYARRVKLTPPEGVAERYKNALKILEKGQKGEVPVDPASNTGDSVSVSAGDRIFTRKTMEKY